MNATTQPVIIPVAGGKGGVGKTLVAANLAIALADLGHSVIVADLDLGGSNLHFFLGLPNRHPGIGDFLKAKAGRLDEFLVTVWRDELRFLPGDGKTPLMANITYAQKEKLLLHLRRLPAEYIVLDLGAGSCFHNLDFFSLVPRGILVTIPEHPAIHNMQVFLKNFLFRVVEREAAGSAEVKELIRQQAAQPMESQQYPIRALLERLAASDPALAERVRRRCASFKPRIVFNDGSNPEELSLAPQLKDVLAQALSLEVEFFGFIFHDVAVKEAVRQHQPLLRAFPESTAAKCIVRLAQRVAKYWGQDIPDSADRLLANTRKLLAEKG